MGKPRKGQQEDTSKGVSSGSSESRAERREQRVAQSFLGKFASRFALLAGGGATEFGALCAFGALAECVNTLITPTVVLLGLDFTGAACNCVGGLICGIAAALGRIGPNASVLSNVFRGGFVAAFTSFCHVVEFSVELHCARNPNSLLYLAFAIASGPACFILGHRLALLATAPFLGGGDGQAAASPETLPLARNFLSACVVVAIASEAQRSGRYAAVELAVGVAATVAACAAGDPLTRLMMRHVPKDSPVNWGTISANSMALLGLVGCEIVRRSHGALSGGRPAAWAALVVGSKFRGSFCGALSAYGAFSEDSAGQFDAGQLDVAAANCGMNALLAVLFAAVLGHASCPNGET